MAKKKTTTVISKTKAKEIPYDVLVQEIFLRLPATSLVRLKSVSKCWHNLITDPTFVKHHLTKDVQHNNFSLVLSDGYHLYTIDEPRPTALSSSSSSSIHHHYHWDFTVMGSCDGLLLLFVPINSFFRIWNPSTRHFIKVPPPPSTPPPPWPSTRNRPSIRLYGFGYDSNLSDYKVLEIIGFGSQLLEVKIFLMSAHSRKWIIIKDLSAGDVFHKVVFPYDDGKFARGALHWLGYYRDDEKSNKEWKIVAFDLGRGEFRGIPLPEQSISKPNPRLSVWGESLYLVVGEPGTHSSDIFVMKEYGVRDSWNKLYTIREAKAHESNPPRWLSTDPQPRLWRIVCFTNDGNILLQRDDNEPAMYDTKSGMIAKVDIDNDRFLKRVFDRGCYVHAYIPSLVPIRKR